MAGEPTLGSYSIPGDPGAISGLAQRLLAASGDIADVTSRLSSKTVPSWSGKAADSFRNHQSEMPGEFRKLQDGFDAGAGALRAFAGQLGDRQSTANWLARKIEQAEHDQGPAERTYQNAEAALSAAKRALSTNTQPAQKLALERAVASASTHLANTRNVLDGINSSISSYRQQAEQNHSEWDQEARSCASQIDAAYGATISHGFLGLLKGAVHDLGKAAKFVGGAELRELKRGVEELDKAYEDVIRPALVILGNAIAVAQIAVLFIPGVGEGLELFLDAANVADSAALLEGDAAMAAQHQRGYGAELLAEDGLNEGMSFVPGGKVLMKAGRALKDAKALKGVSKVFSSDAEKQSDELRRFVAHPTSRSSLLAPGFNRITEGDHYRPSTLLDRTKLMLGKSPSHSDPITPNLAQSIQDERSNLRWEVVDQVKDAAIHHFAGEAIHATLGTGGSGNVTPAQRYLVPLPTF